MDLDKTSLQSQYAGMLKTFIELFNSILEESNYNLNQFVKGESLTVSDDMSEEFLDTLKEFVNNAPEVIKEIDNKEQVWEFFEVLDDYESNNKFIKWLAKYVDSVNRPFEESAFLKDMNNDDFQKITKYCFDNLILQDIGKRKIDKSWNQKEMLILRKVLFTFIEMVIIDNCAKEKAFDNMRRIFDVTEDYCEVWWNYIIKNEDRLWRSMLMKQNRRIEDKLNHLLCALED